MNKLPIYRIQLGDAEGIKIMSLVESPAVEIDFLKFAEQTPLQFSIDEEERVVFGVALRADYPIYRISPRIGEYYVVFERDTIKQLFEKFLIEVCTTCYTNIHKNRPHPNRAGTDKHHKKCH